MKVRVQNKVNPGQKYKHDLTHHNNTTCDFGFVQPLTKIEVEPQSTVRFRIGQALRFLPLSKPTFGKVEVKTYDTFIPLEDIWHAFPNLLGQQSYNGSSTQYIPTSVPTITPAFLAVALRMMGSTYCWQTDSNSTITRTVNSVTIDNVASVPAADIGTVYSYWADYLASASDTYGSSFIPLRQDWSGVDSIPTGGSTTPQMKVDSTLRPSACDAVDIFTVDDVTYVVGVRYSNLSRNLRKVFIGLGYQPNLNDTEPVSMLPLVAYYKAWFDLFQPNREITWTDTYAFRLMEWMEQFGKSAYNTWIYNTTGRSLVNSLFKDLQLCYYTQNVDFASAHIDGTANDIAQIPDYTYLDNSGSTASVSGKTVSTNDQAGASIDSNGISQVALNILKKVSTRINTASVIGGRLDALLKSLFGSAYINDHRSQCFATQKFDGVISDVMNTAETTEGYLGEFAGQGVGDNNGGDFYTFRNDGENAPFGYLIVMTAVVPVSRMSQGMDLDLKHIGVNDFFNTDMDSITLLPTAKKYIFGSRDTSISTSDVMEDNNSLSGGFGNIPNYIEYKTKSNILNGDMSLMSTRGSFLPFTMDRLLPFDSVSYVDDSNTGLMQTVYVGQFHQNNLVNGTRWRYVGLDQWLGNYNRIFVNEGDKQSGVNYYYLRVDDNFVLDNYFDMVKISPAKPIADSWQTEPYGSTLEMEES